MKSLVRIGKAHSAHDYLTAKALQEKLRDDFSSQTSGFDAVLTLPAFGEAPKGLNYTGDAEYCAPWTLLGVPAVALPAGFGENGLPLGLQVVGRYREDYRTLRVAKWIEDAPDVRHRWSKTRGRALSGDVMHDAQTEREQKQQRERHGRDDLSSDGADHAQVDAKAERGHRQHRENTSRLL